jgi:hypothetical protein
MGLGVDVPTPAGVVAVSPSQFGCGNIAGAKQMLADLGYNPGPIDNNVASLSFQKAVLQFAQQQGIDPHGQLGPAVCGPLVQAWQSAQAPVMAPAPGVEPGVGPVAEPGVLPPPGVEEEKFPTWMILAGLGAVALGIGVWYYMA